MARTDRSGNEGDQRQSLLQLTVTGLSGLGLLAAVTYLIWAGLEPVVPPTFTANPAPARAVGEEWHLPLDVTNVGDLSVRALVVSAELREDGARLDSSTVTLDWLPQGSTRQVVLILDADPGRHELVVGFEGYQVP